MLFIRNCDKMDHFFLQEVLSEAMSFGSCACQSRHISQHRCSRHLRVMVTGAIQLIGSKILAVSERRPRFVFGESASGHVEKLKASSFGNQRILSVLIEKVGSCKKPLSVSSHMLSSNCCRTVTLLDVHFLKGIPNEARVAVKSFCSLQSSSGEEIIAVELAFDCSLQEWVVAWVAIS